MSITQKTTDECADCRRDFVYVSLKKINGEWICPECRWLRRGDALALLRFAFRKQGAPMSITQKTTDECADCRRDFVYVSLKKINGEWICPECRWLRVQAQREAAFA